MKPPRGLSAHFSPPSPAERGLYYHEVWRGEGGGSLVCGTMPRNVQDLDFLHFREEVNVVLNVRAECGTHYVAAALAPAP